MSLLAIVQFLTSTALVDAHHGNTNRPRRLSNAQPQISIIGVHIPPLLRRLNNLHYRLEDTLVEVGLFEFPEELLLISLCLAQMTEKEDIPPSYSPYLTAWR